jgi:hypothetical protein
MGVVGDVGIRVVFGVAHTEVALVAGAAAVRVYAKQVVQQKFEQSFSSGPADGRASTTGTTGGFSEEKHGPHLSILAWERSIHPGSAKASLTFGFAE